MTRTGYRIPNAHGGERAIPTACVGYDDVFSSPPVAFLALLVPTRRQAYNARVCVYIIHGQTRRIYARVCVYIYGQTRRRYILYSSVRFDTRLRTP